MGSPDTIAIDTVSGQTAGRRMLIDGRLVESGGRRTFASLNPATGEVLGYAPDASVADAEAAVAAARKAFDTTDWATNVEYVSVASNSCTAHSSNTGPTWVS